MYFLVSIKMIPEKLKNPDFICGLDAALRIISGKWKPLILFFLYKETKRYGELQRCVRGVTHKMLTQQLKELVSDGIVTRKDYREIPPRVEYSLTPLGISLAETLKALCDWGTKNEEAIEAALARREHRSEKRF